MLLLHLSDLHFGSKNRFGSESPSDLGAAFCRSLESIRSECNLQKQDGIDVVVVTGDFTESGLPSQFRDAEIFLSKVRTDLGLESERFVFLPGNHDISWAACKKVRASCEDEELPPHELERTLHSEKLQNYRAFLSAFYGAAVTENSLGAVENCTNIPGGGWLRDFPSLCLSIAALNTSENEDDVRKGGSLSHTQTQALLELWRKPEAASALKVIAIHHNPLSTTRANLEWNLEWFHSKEAEHGGPVKLSADAFGHYLADLAGFEGADFLRAIVADAHPHVILHGHHHDQGHPSNWNWDKDGSAPILSVGSLGLLQTVLPKDVPLSCQILHFQIPESSGPPRLKAIPLVYDPRLRLPGQVQDGAFRVEKRSRGAYDQPLVLPSTWGMKVEGREVNEPERASSTALNSTPNQPSFAAIASIADFAWVLERSPFKFRWEPRAFADSPSSTVVYWPVRLRSGTPIHAVQSFAAAGLQQLGARIVLCLDDLGNVDATQMEFRRSAEKWIKKAGGDSGALEVLLFSDILRSKSKNSWLTIQKWLVEQNNRLGNVLLVSKLLGAEGTDKASLEALCAQKPRRLLTPALVWTCLEYVVNKHSGARFITLGGYDEEKLWAAWRDCKVLPDVSVSHLYIPQLEEPQSKGGDPLYMGRTSLAWASREDIEKALTNDLQSRGGAGALESGRMAKWLFSGCALLPAFVAGNEGRFTGVLQSIEDLNRIDRAELPAALAEVASEWLLN